MGGGGWTISFNGTLELVLTCPDLDPAPLGSPTLSWGTMAPPPGGRLALRCHYLSSWPLGRSLPGPSLCSLQSAAVGSSPGSRGYLAKARCCRLRPKLSWQSCPSRPVDDGAGARLPESSCWKLPPPPVPLCLKADRLSSYFHVTGSEISAHLNTSSLMSAGCRPPSSPPWRASSICPSGPVRLTLVPVITHQVDHLLALGAGECGLQGVYSL